MDDTTTTGETTRLWANRDYLRWLVSDTSGAFSVAVVTFVVPLITLVVTDDPAQAGIVAGAGTIGRALMTLPGGVLADRRDRRALMMVGGLAGAGLLGLLMLSEWAGALGFWALLVINICLGVRTGLLGSASNVALKSLVEQRQLGTALSANQARDATVAMGAGPIAGSLLSLGAVVPLIVAGVGHLTAALSAWRIRTDLRPVTQAPKEVPEERQSPAAAARDGLAWLWSHTLMRRLVMVSTLLNLGLNAALATIVYAMQQEGVSLAVIGLVNTVLGASMLLGAIAAPWLINRIPTGLLAISGLLLVAAAVMILPLATGVPATLVVLALGLLGGPAVNAGLGGYFMAAVPRELIGRAASASELFAMGALPLAPLIAGFGLTLLGRGGTLVLCASICAACALLVLTSRPLRRLPGPDGWSAHDTEQG